MKTISELEKEYSSFKPTSTHITNLKAFLAFIEVGIDDTYDIEKEVKKEIKSNKKWLLETKLINFALFQSSSEETAFIEADNENLLEQIKLVMQYREFYMRMFLVSEEDNIKELVKLVDFASLYYGKHIDYFEYERDQLEMLLKGISLLNTKHEDNREVVGQFIDQKLSILEEQGKEKQFRKAIKHDGHRNRI